MADTHILRRGTQADASAIAALVRAAYGPWVPLIGRDPLPMTVDYAAAVQQHRFDLLCIGEAIAALIETVPRAEDLLVVNLAVSPEQQKRGHGRRLLAHADSLAAAAGLPLLRLYTNSLFGNNVAFYASLGFRIEWDEPFGAGRRVHMARAVTAG